MKRKNSRRIVNWQRVFLLVVLAGLSAILANCGRHQSNRGRTATTAAGTPPPGETSSMPAVTPTAAAADLDCPVTTPTANPPDDTDVFGDGPGAEWLCSDDNELCAVKNGPWPAGGWKVGWRKPLRSTLAISGRRLDREAPPLGAGVPDGYFGTFQASGLIFPTEGCWEVEAEAADSRLRFVVEVEPRERVPQGGSCQTLAEAVEASDGILVGRVVESKPGPEERYVWQEIGVQGIWKNPYGRGSFTGITLLQDTDLEPLLAEAHSYLLFLQRDPFQLFCPERTLAEIVNGELVGVVDDSAGAWPWKEEEAAALRERIKALVTSPQEG